MTVIWLKLLAVLSMLTDHLGIVLYYHRCVDYELYHALRVVGRLAFPLYCFLLAEGFRHLRRDAGRLRLHLLMLMLLAVLSEPFFDQLVDHSFSSLAHQSVIFTLLLGFGGLWLYESLADRRLLRFLPLLLAGAMGLLLHTDYAISGVFLVFGCYFYLELCGDLEFPIRLAGALCLMGFYYLFYCWAHASFGGPEAVLRCFKTLGNMWIPHLLLAPVLAAYGGRLGPRNRVLHRCYQYFYPAHLAALYLLGALLAGQGG